MKKIVIIAGVALALSLPAASSMAATPKPHIAKPAAMAKEGTKAHESGENSATKNGEATMAKKVKKVVKKKK
jgi:hypothetical protein